MTENTAIARKPSISGLYFIFTINTYKIKDKLKVYKLDKVYIQKNILIINNKVKILTSI